MSRPKQCTLGWRKIKPFPVRAGVGWPRYGELDEAIKPLPEAKTQSEYFRFARMIAVAGDFVLKQEKPNAELAKKAFNGWEEFSWKRWEALSNTGFSHWNAGDFNYFPVADRVENDLLLLFVVPLLPQIETNNGDNTEPVFYYTLRDLVVAQWGSLV